MNMRLGKLNKNKGYNYYLFLIGIVFFSLCGCKSSKELQTNLRNNVVSLGYELRTEPVMNENKNVVVLREIGPVFMDYQTVAKRKKFILVPLFFFNYSRTDFKVTLGEFSLEEPFKNFFANALYTQSDCNGNFYLQPNLPDEVNDSVYIVEIDFKNINTHGRINCVDNAILWFDDDLNFGNDFMEYKIGRAHV